MNIISAPAWARSLRGRLLVATVCAIALALLLAGVALGSLFRDHVLRQFETGLARQLDQLTARLDFDATGQPVVDSSRLSDPRWQLPYSGLYWQIDAVDAAGPGRSGVLRSRSLWDSSLQLETDALADGTVHVHQGPGPQGSTLMLLERTVRDGAQAPARWRLVVAADLQDTRRAIDRFAGVLAASLAVLLLLLALAAWAQVAVGLRPLRTLQRSLQQLQHGEVQRIQGRFPTEVQPLVDGFNQVLERNAEVVARARTQAGNLAHALKTPLSVLDQAAARDRAGDGAALAPLVQEQVQLARRQIDWHLARARMAASERLPGQHTALGPVVAGLVRVMERVHAARALAITVDLGDRPLRFAGEEQDLQEMLGNLLDNACKWAVAHVRIGATLEPGSDPPMLDIRIEDDGPGIAPDDRASVLDRGVRLDENVAGTGLGLAIVHDLVALYGGRLDLQAANGGGLSACLHLPAADTPVTDQKRS